MANYSLQTVDPKKTAAGLMALYSLMGSQDQGKLTDAVAQEYLRVTSELPQWAVDQVIQEYRDGKRGDGRFVPKPPQLAANIRKVVELKDELDRAKAKREKDRADIIAQQESIRRWKEHNANKTPESKQRVQAKLEEFKKRSAEVEVEEALTSDQFKRTQDRFAKEARASLLKTLDEQDTAIQEALSNV